MASMGAEEMTAPRTVWAYWHGPDKPSWLRLQTLNTFRRHHPDWDVRLYWEGPDGSALLADGRGEWLARLSLPTWWPLFPESMPPDARSDVFGWAVLANEGGVVVDMDVLFLRPLPGEWIEGPFATTCDGGSYEGNGPGKSREFAIGIIAAAKGDPLAVAIDAAARTVVSKWEEGSNHQALGSRLLAVRLATLEQEVEQEARNIPAESLYPQGFLRQENALIWQPDHGEDYDLDTLAGLHWGGGHERAREMEQRADEEWARGSRCAVARAWRQAMGVK